LGRKKCIHYLIGKLEEKRVFRRLECSWKPNIKKDLNEMAVEYVDRIRVIQDMYRWWFVVKLRVP
jgi:hypothetical protein